MIEEFLEPGLENPLLFGLGIVAGCITYFMMGYQGLSIMWQVLGGVLGTIISYVLVARMASG